MAVGAAHRQLVAQPIFHQPIVIEEDSTLMKVLSCIPLLGIVPAIMQDKTLGLKIFLTDDVPRLVELIKVKNQYKVMNVVRDVISLALIITGLAFGVLSVISCITLGILAISIVLNISRFYENKTVIHILQAKGFVPGLAVS
jgi:hypothetical protein